MISWSAPNVRVFLAREPVDMRKQFHGLLSLAEEVIKQDPQSGHLFVFINRRRDRIKVLYWERTGYCIWYKQLQRGGYELPTVNNESASIELTMSQLSLILDGIELGSAKQRLRFESPSLASVSD
jgi:transposase